MNVSMDGGDGSAGFRRAYSEKILPALEAFRPGLIFISAGETHFLLVCVCFNAGTPISVARYLILYSNGRVSGRQRRVFCRLWDLLYHLTLMHNRHDGCVGDLFISKCQATRNLSIAAGRCTSFRRPFFVVPSLFFTFRLVHFSNGSQPRANRRLLSANTHVITGQTELDDRR